MIYQIAYKATHDETGEVIVGTSKEVAEALGVAVSTIYKVTLEGRKVHGHWKLKKIQDINKPGNDYKFTQDKLDEWDAVTHPFKDAIKRKKERV